MPETRSNLVALKCKKRCNKKSIEIPLVILVLIYHISNWDAYFSLNGGRYNFVTVKHMERHSEGKALKFC